MGIELYADLREFKAIKNCHSSSTGNDLMAAASIRPQSEQEQAAA